MRKKRLSELVPKILLIFYGVTVGVWGLGAEKSEKQVPEDRQVFELFMEAAQHQALSDKSLLAGDVPGVELLAAESTSHSKESTAKTDDHHGASHETHKAHEGEHHGDKAHGGEHHGGGHHYTGEPFPTPLNSYKDSEMGLFQQLGFRVDSDPFNLIGLLIFLGAILHTFAAGSIMNLSHKIEKEHAEKQKKLGNTDNPSILAKLLHFLGEVEAIFGIWVLVLMGAITLFKDWGTMIHYVSETVNYTEPMFVVVIMTIAATKPILKISESIMNKFAGFFGGGSVAAWWFVILTVAPLLGSFITEPAAMTIAALLLVKQFFKLDPSTKFKYGTLGLLFVNVSVGGTLSNFAAPPVLMVAQPWDWSTGFMLVNFGWKAAVGIFIATMAFFLYFRKEFDALEEKRKELAEGEAGSTDIKIPFWVTLVHIGFMLWTVVNAHHPAMFIGGFLFFIGFTQMTTQFQSKLELKTAVLVGFFLAGLVNHGGVQGWWISPVLSSLTEIPLMLIATTLTAFNDNAAITYLSTLVEGFSPALKYAVVAGAVTGGGLTVIANAPNPAGQSILSRYFPSKAVNPLFLAVGAIVPTIIMGLCFMLLQPTPIVFGSIGVLIAVGVLYVIYTKVLAPRAEAAKEKPRGKAIVKKPVTT